MKCRLVPSLLLLIAVAFVHGALDAQTDPVARVDRFLGTQTSAPKDIGNTVHRGDDPELRKFRDLQPVTFTRNAGRRRPPIFAS